MTALVKQSTTAVNLRFLLVLSSDHITGATGITPTVTISKNGAAFASPSGAVTEIANGWYKIAGNATDSNTLGPIDIHATGAACDPTDVLDAAMVVAFDPQDAVRAGLTALPNAAAEAAGGLYTRGTGAGQIKQTNNGEIDANATHVNNVATTSVTTIYANVGQTQPVNFTGTAGSALVKVDAIDLAGQTITAAAGVTFPASVASPTNITAGTITTASAIGTGGITTASFAAGALDSTVIATSFKTAITANIMAFAFAVAYGSYTFQQLISMFSSVLLGKASGLATTTATYRNLADSADVVVATVDSNGNRTAVTLTP